MGTPDNPNPSRLGGTAPLRIALIYFFFASAWIFGSDWLLSNLLSEATIARHTRIQTVKGMVFVITTAALLYLLVRGAVLQIRRSQQVLAESEERYRQMVQWLPTGICVSFEGRVAYVNQALLEMIKTSNEQQVLGKSVYDFIHPDYHALARERVRLVNDEKVSVPLIEEKLRQSDGSYIWVEIAARPIETPRGTSMLSVIRDINQRRQAEDELRRFNETLEQRVSQRTAELQQAIEDLRTFSYMISHDLRTPLHNMTQVASDLLGNDQLDPSAQEQGRRIAASAARLDRLIRDLYEYNHLARSEVRPQRVSLVLLAHDVIGQLSREKEFAGAVFDVREPMPWVLVHRPTLSLVVQNLLHNAVKFVAPGVQPVITISAEPFNGMARLTIEDNGIGMTPERAANIFHLFEQPHESDDAGGSGIGLAIVRRGVERMGGKVGVNSSPGAGSRFWIELPIDPQSP